MRELSIVSFVLLAFFVSEKSLGTDNEYLDSSHNSYSAGYQNFFYQEPESEVDQLLKSIKEVEKKIQSQLRYKASDTVRVLVLGVTGSGKTTLVHSLAGKKLTAKKALGNFNIVPAPNEHLEGFTIGHSLSSETATPNLWYDYSKNLLYCDCPGFLDNRGAKQEIINAFAIDQLFRAPSRIKILLTLQASDFEGRRGMDAIDNLHKLAMLIPDQQQLVRSTSLVVTKKINDDFSVQDILRGLLENVSSYYRQDQKNMDQEERKIEQIINLLTEFAKDSERVFSFPAPVTGGPYVFKDQKRLIENLKDDPVVNPLHAIFLGDHANLYVVELLKKYANVQEITLEFDSLIRAHYKDNPLETLKAWECLVNNLLEINGVHEIETIFNQYFAEGMPERLEKSIYNITTSQRYIEFAEKIMPERQLQNCNMLSALRPFIKAMHCELQHLIKHEAFLIKQERETKNLQDEIKAGEIAQRRVNQQLATLRWEKNRSEQTIRDMQDEMERLRASNSAKLQTQLNQQQQRYDNEIEALRRRVQATSDQSHTIDSLRTQLRKAEARVEQLEGVIAEFIARSRNPYYSTVRFYF